MKKSELIQAMKGNLIVSCQALEGEPLYLEGDTIMHLMARAAKAAGACAIRTNGVRDVIAIREETGLSVIGLIKRSYPGYEPYITPTMKEVRELAEVNADIIAFDATARPRADGRSLEEFIQEIRKTYPDLYLMADIASYEEGIAAALAGVDFVGTTMSGYTEETKNRPTPDYELVKRLANDLDIPVLAEGRIHTPEAAKAMLEAGATAVVVGGAITRPLEITQRFIEAMKG